MNLVIESFARHSQFAETIAGWIFNEFIRGIKHGTTYEMVLEKVRGSREDALPMRFVALSEGKCVGTVYLCANDLKCRSYTPWLAALYVDPAQRGKGVGQALIAHIKRQAKALGYKELYLRTEHASGYYKKLGWEWVEKCDDDYGLKPDVFRVKL